MQFEKGLSGNPGGRPRVMADIIDQCRAASPRAISRLIEIMESQDETRAMRAAISILDRAVGRPAAAAADASSADDQAGSATAGLDALTLDRLAQFQPEERAALREMIDRALGRV